MRRYAFTIFLALLILFVPFAEAAELVIIPELLPPRPAQYARVSTEKGVLNLREKEDDDSRILAKIPNLSAVKVLFDYGEWSQVQYKETIGFVMSKFLLKLDSLQYTALKLGDKGDEVLAFKRAMHGLGYIKSESINTTYDVALENAIAKLQLLNDLTLTPGEASVETQALLDWGAICKAKSGTLNTAADSSSGLTASIFAWDSDGMLMDAEKAVRLKISYSVKAVGGVAPYTITVRKSLSATGGSVSGDV
ncbi:MAG: SH3 domain-containing protein, partial [Oscillospiraceae bacterium]|nr:SH3 domain-containing protein [Oscillospiraceae bacterium]